MRKMWGREVNFTCLSYFMAAMASCSRTQGHRGRGRRPSGAFCGEPWPRAHHHLRHDPPQPCGLRHVSSRSDNRPPAKVEINPPWPDTADQEKTACRPRQCYFCEGLPEVVLCCYVWPIFPAASSLLQPSLSSLGSLPKRCCLSGLASIMYAAA